MNKLYLTLYEMDSLCLENCRMGWEPGSFCRIKSKEEKNRKYLTGWGHRVNLAWGEKEQGNKYRAQSWLGVWGLATGYTAFLVKQSIYRDIKVI